MIGTITAAALGAAAGTLPPEVPAIGVPVSDARHRFVGHIYFNAATGASVFTPAKEYLANRARSSLRAIGDDINNDGRPDVWINTNTDPCPIGTTASPYTHVAALDNETTQGDHHLYKAQLGHPSDGSYTTDALVESFTISFWTDVLDTDADLDTVPDGNTRGHGLELTFWDKEDFFGKSSCYCPLPAGGPPFTREHLVTFALTNLPGALTPPAPGYMAGYVLTFDLGNDGTFEIADSDGVGPASGHFNPFVAALDVDQDDDTIPEFASADTDGNGTIDWSYSFRAIQPTNPGPDEGLIGYQTAAPGRFGAAGQLAPDCATPLNPQGGVPGDGLIDYISRTTAPAPLQWDAARVTLDSIEAPMGLGFPFASAALGSGCQTMLSRFSLFFASLGETPDPDGPPPVSPFTCAGLSNSDFFGWGAVHPPTNQFIGSLNCTIDDDGDTIPDGRPWSGAFLALSQCVDCGPLPCDCDGNGILNIDDIDCWVAAFLAGDLATADCDRNGILNIDDIDCFVTSFLAGCF